MNPSVPSNTMTADLLALLGAAMSRCRLSGLASRCLERALEADPQHLNARLQLGNISLQEGRYETAALYFKEAIGLQPTLSTVYKLGVNLSKVSDLNDGFYKTLLSVVETPEILAMVGSLAASATVYQPSMLWKYFMAFNTFQLETSGIGNFKRTVNNNYFNWTADLDVNTQYQALRDELHWTADDLVRAEEFLRWDDAEKPSEFTGEKWKKYSHFLCMLWEYASRNDRLGLLQRVEEPELGHPVAIEYKGHRVTQDICNSVMEINTIMERIEWDPAKKMRVMELGAGHGRIENVLLRTLADPQVVVVDIPPALYVSQWYLSNLFPDRKIFRFRDFSSYGAVQREFEEASIAFLLPSQVEYLPDGTFDLFINISSLHEMTHAQIAMWFDQVDRVCKRWFYTKQYIESENGFDGIVVRRDEYPVKPHWQEMLNRQNPVYPHLFEALYKVH